MSFEYIRKLPTPDEIREEFPFPAHLTELKKKRDEEIRKVLTGESNKFLVIIGPCSADNEDSVCDYVSRLARINEDVKDRLILIPRIYTNKPRTIGVGYKGMLHQPDPEKKEDMLKGIIAIRELHTRAVKETGFTCADEMLYPENHRYLSDILVLCGSRCTFRRRPTASSDCKWSWDSGRNEESDRRGYFCYDEFHDRCTAWTYVFIPGLGSDNNRKSICTRYFTRICGQVWTQYSKLSL